MVITVHNLISNSSSEQNLLFNSENNNLNKLDSMDYLYNSNKAKQTLGQQSTTVNRQTIAGQYLYVFTLFDIMSYLNSKNEFPKWYEQFSIFSNSLG